MSLNKKQKKRSSIVTTFVFNIIIISGFFSLLILVILPSFNEIEEKKNDLIGIITENNQTLKEGIIFTDFRKSSTWNSDVDKTLL